MALAAAKQSSAELTLCLQVARAAPAAVQIWPLLGGLWQASIDSFALTVVEVTCKHEVVLACGRMVLSLPLKVHCDAGEVASQVLMHTLMSLGQSVVMHLLLELSMK